MRAIVTVKLPRNPLHDPERKLEGRCPLCDCGSDSLEPRVCTDITGSHHSYVETGLNKGNIRKKAERRFGHVTRIEVLEL